MRLSMGKVAHYRSLPRRFRRRTLLLVGCGDVGGRIGRLLARHARDRLRVVGTARSDEQIARLRGLGIVPLRVDLDDARTLPRLAAFSDWMVDLAPPPDAGPADPRSVRLIAALSRRYPRPARVGRAATSGRPASPSTAPPRRWVYVSTTGVYGDCAGAEFDETRPVAPRNERAVRRVEAERRFREATRRAAARASPLAPVRAAILRVPGIYGHDRLPLERLRRRLPALATDEDVFTNHIHADDLARLCWAAVFRGLPGRVVHAVDDSDLKMGDYFDLVARAFDLPQPPRVSRAELAATVSPVMLSFMSESRRLRNRRLKRELRVRLRWPTVEATLADAARGLSDAPRKSV